MRHAQASRTPKVRALAGPGAPLNAASDDLALAGHLEEELILQGEASRYRLHAGGGNAEWVDGGHPYRTRMLLRRPAQPARFSGTVVVEWLNVSCGQDLDFVYAATRELVLRDGHAWLGVSVQRAGVDRLASARPQRYGQLSVTAPGDDPATGAPLDLPHPLTQAPGCDVLGWDIFSDAGRWVRAQAQAWGGPSVTCLIAAGESQSAIRLSHYFNSVQPLQGVYDGFLLYDRAGPMALREDIAARAISIGTDFFAELAGGSPPHDANNQRWWDLAGSSHVSWAEMRDHIDPQVLRDGLQQLDGQAVSLTALMAAQHGADPQRLWSPVPNGDLVKAALRALVGWVLHDHRPAQAPRLEFAALQRLRRDAQGRTAGGIRFAAHEWPSGLHDGIGPPGLALTGRREAFSVQELRRRYGQPEVYLAGVQQVVQANLAQGFLLAPEAERVLAEARALAQSFAPDPS